MILNTGDVPNLYPPDEKAEIIEKMQVVARTQVCSVTVYRDIVTHTSLSLPAGTEDRCHSSLYVQLLH